MGLSENSVPLHPMVLLIIIPTKWLFHWGYTPFSDKPTWWLLLICRNQSSTQAFRHDLCNPSLREVRLQVNGVNRESSSIQFRCLKTIKNHMGQDLRTQNVSKRYQIHHFLTNQLSQLGQLSQLSQQSHFTSCTCLFHFTQILPEFVNNHLWS